MLHYVDGIYYTLSSNGGRPQGKMWAMDPTTYDSVYSDKDSYMLPNYPEKWFTSDNVTITKENGKEILVLNISSEAYIEYMVEQGMSAEGAPDFEKIELSITIGADGRIASWTTYMSFSQGTSSLVGESTATFSDFGTTVVTAPENLEYYEDPSTPPSEDNGNEENKDVVNKEEEFPNNGEENKDVVEKEEEELPNNGEENKDVVNKEEELPDNGEEENNENKLPDNNKQDETPAEDK